MCQPTVVRHAAFGNSYAVVITTFAGQLMATFQVYSQESGREGRNTLAITESYSSEVRAIERFREYVASRD